MDGSTVDGPRSLRVLLGVSGGIAAYKAAELVRRLRERGHQVRCALTPHAAAFVAPLTLEVLSGHQVCGEEYLAANGSGEELHVTAAQWADVLCLAPATAHLLGRLAHGLADDFLTTTVLAATAPLVVAPAMHHQMWRQPAVQANVALLVQRGVRLVGPVEGPLASGEVGMGRLADLAEIVAVVEAAARGAGELAGRTVVISAGPTHEPVDSVRYLANRSSGKMGFALAAEAARRGARVVLVAGPVELPTPPGVERVDVVTAHQMQAAIHHHAPAADVVIMSAAVADFRPAFPAAQKIKKEAGIPQLVLAANPDVLAGLGAVAPAALRIGFAAETDHVEANARKKLAHKDAHMIVANDVSRADIGFSSDANEVTVYRRQLPPVFFSRRPKEQLAADLMALFGAALADHELDRAQQSANTPA